MVAGFIFQNNKEINKLRRRQRLRNGWTDRVFSTLAFPCNGSPRLESRKLA
jgi:hypothetical protein